MRPVLKSVFQIVIMTSLTAFVSCNCQRSVVCIKSTGQLQSQLNKSNTTYLVENLVDLRGKTIVMPKNSVLKFSRNGVLSNGVLVGENTLFDGKPCLDGVRLKGQFKSNEFYTSWCSQEAMSDYIEDVMNLSYNTVMIVDCDITLKDTRKYVSHLSLMGKNKTITNSDRFNVTYGGTEITNLKFRWNKPPVVEPADNYDAVVVYHNLLEKDTIIKVMIENVDADGGRYCSYFMRQYKSSIQPKLQIINTIKNGVFCGFTRGVIWTCGGSGVIEDCEFRNIGYDQTKSLWSVTALRLGYDTRTHKAKAKGYKIENNLFYNIVAAYNPKNDGRELHGLLAYGDSIVVRKNKFRKLSTSFSRVTDTGMDSEMLYIKGSFNIIEDNTFEDGAGAASDGMVTLKIGSSEGNVLRNNELVMASTSGKFIYLGGSNHLVEGNNFISTYSPHQDNGSYAIYLGHHDSIGIKESVIIKDNTFRFPETNNYTVVYANKWGDLSLMGNSFYNPTRLLKCNKREGTIIVNNNIITLNRIKVSGVDNFIELSESINPQAIISNNVITLTNTTLGRLVKGSNYCFNSNNVTLKKTTLKTLLQGNDADLKNGNNAISIDNSSKVAR